MNSLPKKKENLCCGGGAQGGDVHGCWVGAEVWGTTVGGQGGDEPTLPFDAGGEHGGAHRGRGL